MRRLTDDLKNLNKEQPGALRTLQRPIKILFIIVQMGMGGAERLVHSLIGHLNRQQFIPHLAWFLGDDVHPEFMKLEIPMFRLGKRRKIDFSTMRQLAKIMKENSIDVVNTQHFMPMIYALYGCKIAKKAGLICTFHSEWEIEEIPTKWRLIGSRVIKKIDSAVVVNSRIAEVLANKLGFDARRVLTIRNGVDLGRFGRRDPQNGLRKSLGIENNEAVIGAVGNLKEVKNHLLLLKAFELLVKENPGVKLILVGQGFEGDHDNTEPQIREFIKTRGLGHKILLLGYREDIPSVLQIMDIFCLTSKMEGLPISLIEAMAAGVAVIGTNVQGIREVISKNHDGILVESSDVTGLKDALMTLIRDRHLRTRIGEAGREKAAAIYSLDRCVMEYEKLFLSVAKQNFCKGN